MLRRIVLDQCAHLVHLPPAGSAGAPSRRAEQPVHVLGRCCSGRCWPAPRRRCRADPSAGSTRRRSSRRRRRRHRRRRAPRAGRPATCPATRNDTVGQRRAGAAVDRHAVDGARARRAAGRQTASSCACAAASRRRSRARRSADARPGPARQVVHGRGHAGQQREARRAVLEPVRHRVRRRHQLRRAQRRPEAGVRHASPPCAARTTCTRWSRRSRRRARPRRSARAESRAPRRRRPARRPRARARRSPPRPGWCRSRCCRR